MLGIISLGTMRVGVRVRVMVRVTVRVSVRVRGGAYFHTHIHARQGCQACGLVRVASGLVERERVVEQVAPMPHASNTQAAQFGIHHPSICQLPLLCMPYGPSAQFGIHHPSYIWVLLPHPVMCAWPLNSQSQCL